MKDRTTNATIAESGPKAGGDSEGAFPLPGGGLDRLSATTLLDPAT